MDGLLFFCHEKGSMTICSTPGVNDCKVKSSWCWLSDQASPRDLTCLNTSKQAVLTTTTGAAECFNDHVAGHGGICRNMDGNKEGEWCAANDNCAAGNYCTSHLATVPASYKHTTGKCTPQKDVCNKGFCTWKLSGCHQNVPGMCKAGFNCFNDQHWAVGPRCRNLQTKHQAGENEWCRDNRSCQKTLHCSNNTKELNSTSTGHVGHCVKGIKTCFKYGNCNQKCSHDFECKSGYCHNDGWPGVPSLCRPGLSQGQSQGGQWCRDDKTCTDKHYCSNHIAKSKSRSDKGQCMEKLSTNKRPKWDDKARCERSVECKSKRCVAKQCRPAEGTSASPGDWCDNSTPQNKQGWCNQGTFYAWRKACTTQKCSCKNEVTDCHWCSSDADCGPSGTAYCFNKKCRNISDAKINEWCASNTNCGKDDDNIAMVCSTDQLQNTKKSGDEGICIKDIEICSEASAEDDASNEKDCRPVGVKGSIMGRCVTTTNATNAKFVSDANRCDTLLESALCHSNKSCKWTKSYGKTVTLSDDSNRGTSKTLVCPHGYAVTKMCASGPNSQDCKGTDGSWLRSKIECTQVPYGVMTGSRTERVGMPDSNLTFVADCAEDEVVVGACLSGGDANCGSEVRTRVVCEKVKVGDKKVQGAWDKDTTTDKYNATCYKDAEGGVTHVLDNLVTGVCNTGRHEKDCSTQLGSKINDNGYTRFKCAKVQYSPLSPHHLNGPDTFSMEDVFNAHCCVAKGSSTTPNDALNTMQSPFSCGSDTSVFTSATCKKALEDTQFCTNAKNYETYPQCRVWCNSMQRNSKITFTACDAAATAFGKKYKNAKTKSTNEEDAQVWNTPPPCGSLNPNTTKGSMCNATSLIPPKCWWAPYSRPSAAKTANMSDLSACPHTYNICIEGNITIDNNCSDQNINEQTCKVMMNNAQQCGGTSPPPHAPKSNASPKTVPDFPDTFAPTPAPSSSPNSFSFANEFPWADSPSWPFDNPFFSPSSAGPSALMATMASIEADMNSSTKQPSDAHPDGMIYVAIIIIVLAAFFAAAFLWKRASN